MTETTNLIGVDLSHETDITWLVPTCRLPRYVRETIVMCKRRRGPIRHCGRIVGWANLSKAAHADCDFFTRRVFWLADHDPYEGSGAPCEAVDPFTVSPGDGGRMTERAWGKKWTQ